MEKAKEKFNKIFIEKDFEYALKVFSLLKEMVDFDQMNIYHDKDLWKHTIATVEGLIDNREKDEMIYWAALFHDVGKLFTQTEGKKKTKQVILVNVRKHMHYYGHPQKSKKLAEKHYIPILQTEYSDEELNRMLKYIEFHDLDYGRIVDINKYYKKGFNKEEVKNLMYLQYADLNAHKIELLQDKKARLEEQFKTYFNQDIK